MSDGGDNDGSVSHGETKVELAVVLFEGEAAQVVAQRVVCGVLEVVERIGGYPAFCHCYCGMIQVEATIS